MQRKTILLAFGLAAAIGLGTSGAQAASILEEWANVKAPAAPPPVKEVAVDPKTTALLMLDFMNQNCGKRASCLATIPAMKKLLAEARAAKASVVYSITGSTTTADVIKDVAPEQGEPFVQAGPDKFFRTDLEKILKDKGIETVIVAGTASNGAVLFTGAGAAIRGLKVIVPVDGMSAAEPYADLTTAYTFAAAPTLSARSTLTTTDMIKF